MFIAMLDRRHETVADSGGTSGLHFRRDRYVDPNDAFACGWSIGGESLAVEDPAQIVVHQCADCICPEIGRPDRTQVGIVGGQDTWLPQKSVV